MKDRCTPCTAALHTLLLHTLAVQSEPGAERIAAEERGGVVVEPAQVLRPWRHFQQMQGSKLQDREQQVPLPIPF